MNEQKVCTTCPNSFIVEDADRTMLAWFDLPDPTQCHICIWKHLLSFWVFGKFRKTQSALSGKTIFTVFPESINFPLYSREEFVSDAWDPMAYGMDYDPARSFFDQFAELQRKVPHPHQCGTKNMNCEWSDDVWTSKNCYLCRSLIDCEDLSYGYRVLKCKNSIDITYCFDMEYSYDCLYCFKCYKSRHCFNSRQCLESAFLYDCHNCANCFMSWNLRNKEYCIRNVQYSRAEYEQKVKQERLDSYMHVVELKKEFAEILKNNAVHRVDFNYQITNSTGNFLAEDKNCKECYLLEKSENCRYILRGTAAKDSLLCVGAVTEKSILSMLPQWNYEAAMTTYADHSRYSMYLEFCEEVEYCFGCVGLRKKKYCIFNKQYTRVAYEEKIKEIKAAMKASGEWGKFFPMNMAYCGYNYSLAQMMFPETKERIKALGGKWEEEEVVTQEGIPGDAMPDTIAEVPSDITTKPIICPKTGKRFNIAPHELAFYKAHNIPPPRNHFDWRTLDQFARLVAVIPQKGKCCYCDKEITHYYPLEWGYKKIACVACYQNEVI